MRDNLENWDALLVRLKHSLQALAMPADTQLELSHDFVCKVEELALDFDHWSRCVLSNNRGELSEEQKSLLRKLDGTFDQLSGGQSQNLWTEDALRNSPEWQTVRDIARAALTSFGWAAERPPSYQHEYVPGTNI
ncbi:MAG TPA: hypothetical protein VIQ24_03110 [Pyrinomonadaceae bacterium]